jgi:mannose-6-phosphate isomerase-like protein (cupin superfamily)
MSGDMSDAHLADAAPPVVDRRDAVRWLALVLTGSHVGELFAESGAPPARPSGRQPEPVTFLDAAMLRQAIRAAPEEKPGQPGLYSVQLSGESGYPVLGIRRTATTRSEAHASFTDVWYVLEGSASLVTGGTIVEGIATAQGEIRGRSIAGGDTRRIQAGDFAIVPAGVPHWVSQLERELLYLVVKVPAPTRTKR